MSKSQKNRNKEESLERRAFETLNKQVHQFDEPSRLSKNICPGTGNKTKPSKLAVSLRLKNGKVINGACVCFDDPKKPKSKLFFPLGQKDTGGNSKKLYIPSPISAQSQGGNTALMKDVNDFLRDIHEQSLCEFPEWLEKWGCRANENNPLLNLDEIREEWKFKKSRFGIFRLAAQAGFFSSSRPLEAERYGIVEIEICDFSPNSIHPTAQEGTQPLTNY